MILLDDNLASVVASWAQVGIGISALIISFVAALQSKKIKELTDITSELTQHTAQLTQQTKLISERNALESLVTIMDRIPYFIRKGYVSINPEKVRIDLENIGILADLVVVSCLDENLFSDITIYSDSVNKNETLSLIMSPYPQYEYALYSFDVYFRDRAHTIFFQTVHITPETRNIVVNKPKEAMQWPKNQISKTDRPIALF